MADDFLAKDGYSERPPLFRALGLSLISLVLALADGPRYMVVLLAAGAGLEYVRFALRRRDRLGRPRAQ